MEEFRTKVNPGNIGGDVVDEHTVCQRQTRSRREFEGAIVNDGYETSSQEDTGRGCTVEKVIVADGCNDLQGDKPECITDS